MVEEKASDDKWYWGNMTKCCIVCDGVWDKFGKPQHEDGCWLKAEIDKNEAMLESNKQ